jgi:GH15 family glucan-1,4-alpha-glucosidase
VADGIGEHCWNEDKSSYSRAMWLTVPSYMYEQATGQGMTGYTRTSAKGYISYHLQYDATADISLLGISVPFSVVPASNERMARTADTIERLLTVPDVGGIKRYEDDTYAGGNPWILTTLWLAQYRAASGQYEEAKRLLRWALDHRTNAGLLPEQVDKHTGTTAWVVPLTWSHAMFVLTVSMLSEHGQL